MYLFFLSMFYSFVVFAMLLAAVRMVKMPKGYIRIEDQPLRKAKLLDMQEARKRREKRKSYDQK